MIRRPAVAGQFYPGNRDELMGELDRLVPHMVEKRKVLGVISPHAGYIYSGATAGRLLASIKIPRTVVIIGPNHHGAGALAALSPDDEWQTPLGNVSVAKNLSSILMEKLPAIKEDTLAHLREHSLEVQVPFLQYLQKDLEILPLCIGFGDYPGAEMVGQALAAAIEQYGEEVLVLASSDMTHYESAESARSKDLLAIGHILELDPKGLVDTCRSKKITMCGVMPSAVMLIAALKLGATRAELLEYTNSGEVTGDNRQVVAYASVAVM